MVVTAKKEKDVKHKVKAILAKHGWYWWMTPANGFGRSGIADICAIKAGVFMAIETKFGKNTASAMQKGFLNSIHAEQCFAFVVSDQNVEWFQAFMTAFDEAATAQMNKQEVKTETGAMMLNAIRELISGFI
jgi:Holliday junction resolvase